MEHPRLAIVMLLVALANLATDLTRFLMELSSLSAIHQNQDMRARPPQSEFLQQATAPTLDLRQSDTKKTETRSVRDARGPPHRAHWSNGTETALQHLPPDYSINHPPWCLACRAQPTRRYFEGRHLYEW
jgi:hypothetical protein